MFAHQRSIYRETIITCEDLCALDQPFSQQWHWGFDWFFLFPCTRHSWMWHTRRNKRCNSCDSQRKCDLQLKHGFWKPRCGSLWRPCDDWRQQRVSWRCHGSLAPTTPALQSYERRKGVKKDGWQCLGSALSVHPVLQNY